MAQLRVVMEQLEVKAETPEAIATMAGRMYQIAIASVGGMKREGAEDV